MGVQFYISLTHSFPRNRFGKEPGAWAFFWLSHSYSCAGGKILYTVLPAPAMIAVTLAGLLFAVPDEFCRGKPTFDYSPKKVD